AVFAGGVALDTLEDFFNTGMLPTSDIIHTAHSLLNKSLLQQVGSQSPNPRVYMLYTIREYGSMRLHDQGELEECQRSHALYYLHLVEKAMGYLRGAKQDLWLQLLEQEQSNLEAALEWLVIKQETMLALRFIESFGKFCGLRGYWSKEKHWLTSTLTLPNSSESKQIRARVLRRTGYLSYRLGDLEIARELLEESIVISRKCADKQNLAGALAGLGLVLSRQKDTSYADKLLHESVRIAREAGDTWTIANALHNLAHIIHSQGRPDEAHRLLTESLRLSRQ